MLLPITYPEIYFQLARPREISKFTVKGKWPTFWGIDNMRCWKAFHLTVTLSSHSSVAYRGQHFRLSCECLRSVCPRSVYLRSIYPRSVCPRSVCPILRSMYTGFASFWHSPSTLMEYNNMLVVFLFSTLFYLAAAMGA